MNRPHRGGRDVHGVIVLDKPQGIYSNSILQKIKRMYNANRAGYIGTLDSLATGILPICLGEATKFSQYLLNSDKRYHVTAKLGQRTDTHDRYGKIIEEHNIDFSTEQLYIALDSFRGNIVQVPPMYSALKYHGKKLYEYAKQGIEVQRKARPVIVYELIFIRQEDTELELEIHCSKGTYIRTIIDDLGKKLSCGAHVTSLRRIAMSKYTVEHMVPLSKLYLLEKQEKKQGITPFKLLDTCLMPVYSTVIDFPIINLSLKHSINFKKGSSIHINDTTLSGLVRVTEGEDNKFIGIGELDNKGVIMPRRLIA